MERRCIFPASCSTCITADGYLTGYHKWQLGQDSNVRLGMLSFKQDFNFVNFLFASAEQFEKSLVEEQCLNWRTPYPDQMHSFWQMVRLILSAQRYSYRKRSAGGGGRCPRLTGSLRC